MFYGFFHGVQESQRDSMKVRVYAQRGCKQRLMGKRAAYVKGGSLKPRDLHSLYDFMFWVKCGVFNAIKIELQGLISI